MVKRSKFGNQGRIGWRGFAHALRSWAVAHPHDYALTYGSPVPGYAAPQGTIVWQEDLVTFGISGVNPKPTSDGGYITAGYALPSETGPLGGLIMKLSAPVPSVLRAKSIIADVSVPGSMSVTAAPSPNSVSVDRSSGWMYLE